MASFAELDLSARTDKLERAVDEIRKIGVEGERTENKVRNSTGKMRDEFGRFVKQTEGATDALGGLGGQAQKSTGAMSVGFGKLAGVAAGFAGAILSVETAMASFAAARQFNAALAETATLIDGNVQQMAVITEGARAMSREFGGNATAQVQAYYQAISAGAGSAENATILLDAANKLAIGGVTDVTTGVDVLTTAMNAYRAQGLTAAEASDALFVGMKAGKTTVGQLSASIGQVLPIATSLGVSFDETVAAMAALTTQGISTAQAATGVRAAMTSMIAPTDQAKKLAAELGIEFSAAGVEALGFGGMMDQVIAKTGGNTALIQQLFGSIEATTAALSFAGGAGEVFGGIMDQMAVKAGATGAAYDAVADSLDQRLKVVLGQAGDAALAFGNTLLTVIVPAAEGAMAAANFLGENMAAMGLVAASLAATALPSLAVATYGAVTAFAAGTAGAGILTGALGLLRGALMLAGGPWGILAGLIVAAAGYFLLFRDNAGEAKNGMDASRDATAELNTALGTFYQTAAPSAAQEAINLANKNYELENSAYAAAKAELEKARAMQMAQYNSKGYVDPNTPLVIGQSDPKLVNDVLESRMAERRISEALDALDAAESRLEESSNRRRQATTAVTGAMSENFAETKGEIDALGAAIENLGNVATGGGGGGALGAAKDGMNELEEATKAMNAALAPVESSAENAFVSFVTGAKDARGAVADLMGDLAKLAAQSAFRTLAGNLFKASGPLGSVFAGLFDQGGMIPSGQFGIVGERGPEFVQGPAMVTSRADTAKMMGGSTRVDVMLHVPDGVTVQQATAIAGNVSVRVMQAGLAQNRQALPSQINQINSRGR